MTCDTLAVGPGAEVAVAIRIVQGVDAEPHPDRAVVDRLAELLHQLEGEADPVLERSAVLVGAFVVEAMEEEVREGRKAVEDCDQIEAGSSRSLRGIDVLFAGLLISDLSIARQFAHGTISLGICETPRAASRVSPL